MSTFRLERVFVPKSVAVIGGSPRPIFAGCCGTEEPADVWFQGAVCRNKAVVSG
jgi:hypothetical protein